MRLKHSFEVLFTNSTRPPAALGLSRGGWGTAWAAKVQYLYCRSVVRLFGACLHILQGCCEAPLQLSPGSFSHDFLCNLITQLHPVLVLLEPLKEALVSLHRHLHSCQSDMNMQCIKIGDAHTIHCNCSMSTMTESGLQLHASTPWCRDGRACKLDRHCPADVSH